MTITNHTDAILAAKNITVRWTEAACADVDKLDMNLADFVTLLHAVNAEARVDLKGGAYLKVAFLADGRSFRIDLDGTRGSANLINAWLY